MIRICKAVSRHLWRWTLLSVILLGIAVVAVRLLLPQIDTLREDAEAWAGQALGQPVRIGRIGATWHGIGPRLVFRDVTLLQRDPPHAPLLTLPTLRVQFDVPASLQARALRIKRIVAEAPALTILRHADGRISIVSQGDQPPTDASAEAAAAALLLLPFHFNIEEGRITWQDEASGRELALTDINLSFARAGDRYWARLGFLLGGSPIEAQADLQSDSDTPAGTPTGTPTGWRGDLYLRTRDARLAPLLGVIPGAERVRDGQLSLEAWGRVEAGRFADWVGRVNLEKLTLGTPGRGTTLDALGGRFRWAPEGEGSRLDLLGMVFRRAGTTWPLSRAALAWLGEGRGWVAGMDYLDLADLRDLIGAALPDGMAVEALQGLRPQGTVRDLRLTYRTDEAGPRWSAHGQLLGVEMEPWNQIPGVARIDAAFYADPAGGWARLASPQVTARFPGLFRWPLQLRRLEGDLAWGLPAPGGWWIESPRMTAVSPDITTRTRLRMEQPADPAATPTLDLRTDFEDGNATATPTYLPTGIMGPQVVSWLDRAFKGGHVIAGSCVVQGPLRDFPYDETGNGEFEILFETERMTLDYREGWPPIEELAARVRFFKNSLEIQSHSGRIYDAVLKDVRVRIDELSLTSPLIIRGGVEGDLAAPMRLLAESPLSEKFAPLVSKVEGRGPMRLELGIEIPLETDDDARLDGRLHLNEATLRLKDAPVQIDRIKGELAITQDGVTAKGLTGEVWETRITADVHPEEDHHTWIDARARVGAKQLSQLKLGPWLERLKGTADLLVRIGIPPLSAAASAPLVLELSSDLKGLGSELPAPLGKAAGEPMPLKAEARFGDPEAPWHARLGDLLDLQLLAPADKPLRADLVLGGEAAKRPEAAGIAIRGRLKRLDLDPWLELIAEAPAKAGKGAPGPDLRRVALGVDAFSASGLGLADLRIAATRDAETWQGRIDSDRIDGDLVIPLSRGAGPGLIHLQRLALPKPDPNDGPPDTRPDPPPPPGPDPRTLPGGRILVDRLLIGEQEAGRIQVEASPQADGLRFDTLELETPEGQASGSGAWAWTAQGPRSTVELDVISPSLGALLGLLGYAPPIDRGPAKMAARLAWPGAPWSFSRTWAEGELHMDLGAGQFLEVNPGLGRVFGLLNIGALQRRLKLDFSDLTRKGFAFDSIAGDFQLQGGNATTGNLSIKGPAASLEITGRTGLVAQDLDQEAVVTAHLSSSIPIAGAIAGGPAVGAVLYVAQQALGEKVDNLSSIRYHIQGPWDEPRVERISGLGDLGQKGTSRRGDGERQANTPDLPGQAPPAPPQEALPVTAEPEPPPAEGSPGPIRSLWNKILPGKDAPDRRGDP